MSLLPVHFEAIVYMRPASDLASRKKYTYHTLRQKKTNNNWKRMAKISVIWIHIDGWIGLGQSNNKFFDSRRAHYFQPVWQSTDFSISNGEFSIWTPSSAIQGYYPMGHAINSGAETESSMNPSFLVFHAGDDKFSTPSDVLIDTSYSFFF